MERKLTPGGEAVGQRPSEGKLHFRPAPFAIVGANLAFGFTAGLAV